MKWKIRSIKPGGYNGLWRTYYGVFVDERQVETFGQQLDGRWRVTGGMGDYFLTRRAARAAALKLAGITVEMKVPAVFYEDGAEGGARKGEAG